jgi:hypothetical protein
MAGELGIKGRNPLALLELLWQPVPLKLDFHNVSPPKLLKWIRSAPKPLNGEPHVLVLIGHTKEHIDDRPFEKLLQLIAAEPNLKVVGFSDVANMMHQNGTPTAECANPKTEERGLRTAWNH